MIGVITSLGWAVLVTLVFFYLWGVFSIFFVALEKFVTDICMSDELLKNWLLATKQYRIKTLLVMLCSAAEWPYHSVKNKFARP